MIRVYANFLKYDTVSLFDFFTNLIKGLLAVRTPEYCLSVLYGRYEMVMYLIGIVFSGPNRSHTLKITPMVTAQQADAELSS